MCVIHLRSTSEGVVEPCPTHCVMPQASRRTTVEYVSKVGQGAGLQGTIGAPDKPASVHWVTRVAAVAIEAAPCSCAAVGMHTAECANQVSHRRANMRLPPALARGVQVAWWRVPIAFIRTMCWSARDRAVNFAAPLIVLRMGRAVPARYSARFARRRPDSIVLMRDGLYVGVVPFPEAGSVHFCRVRER